MRGRKASAWVVSSPLLEVFKESMPAGWGESFTWTGWVESGMDRLPPGRTSGPGPGTQ